MTFCVVDETQKDAKLKKASCTRYILYMYDFVLSNVQEKQTYTD